MREPTFAFQMPRPGRAIRWALGILVGIWVLFALGINFFGVPPAAFYALAGSSDAILAGQVWRLFTAGLLHPPSGPGAASSLVWSVLGLYFLGPSLEQAWGARRTAWFLAGSILAGFVVQFAAEVLLPGAVTARLGQDYWYGPMAAVEAVAVAWALSNRGQTVSLMFVLPVGTTGLLLFVVGLSVLRVIAADKPTEGVFAPFGGMLAGYLFGAGSPTPARRLWLRVRYAWTSGRAARARSQRISHASLRVIEGERARDPRKRPPSDKRFLN